MRLLIESIDSLEGNVEEYYKYLTKERVEKIKGFKATDDKKRSILAGLIINACAALATDTEKITSHKVESVLYDNHGKPFFETSKVKFNVSHSGKYVAGAYGDKELGIDVQKKKKLRPEMERRIRNAKDTIEDTLLLWTIKEAYIKMLGKGLSYDMRNCYVDVDRKMVVNLNDSNKNAMYELIDFDDDYALCVCEAC